jgi:hypothetical protein
MAWRLTTALREPWIYGLRGWISTRSNDLAQVLLQRLLQVLLKVYFVKYFRLAVCQGGSCGIFGQPAGMLWGFIKGARAA